MLSICLFLKVMQFYELIKCAFEATLFANILLLISSTNSSSLGVKGLTVNYFVKTLTCLRSFYIEFFQELFEYQTKIVVDSEH